jgi:hypothetical protein
MAESKFLATLFPTHPDLLPIVQSLRKKYRIPDVDPDGEPISELYFEDEAVSLKDFHLEIETLIRKNLSILPPKTVELYNAAKKHFDRPLDLSGFESVSDENKKAISNFMVLAENMMGFYLKLGDSQIKSITHMLYVYMLMGEAEELPKDWLGTVATVRNSDGETIIIAMANQLSNPDVLSQQFRDAYRKSFGAHRPKMTEVVVSTAYYMQLRRMGKPWNFIVEEYIRRNKFSLPRDRASKRYFEIRSKHEQTLRKRIQRAEKILDIITEDKK